MFRSIILTFIMCFCLIIISNNASALTAQDARQFVDDIGNHALNVINDAAKDENQKHAKLRQMFSENVDIHWMGRFVLGTGWKQATEDQKKHYMQAYQQYMVAHYTANFSDYTGSKYNISDIKNEQDGEFTVAMQIKTSKELDDISAGYRLRTDNVGFKIVDIIIEGISLVVTQRSEFASLISQKGIDGLISSLEEKTKEESSRKTKS